MLGVLKNGCYSVLALLLVLSTAQVQAAHHVDCDENIATITQQLQRIEQELHNTRTKHEYQASVKKRFEVVDKLLLLSGQCIANGNGEIETAKQWYQIKMTLASLQASAQVSAFTKFDDWLTAKELDLSAFENAKQGKW